MDQVAIITLIIFVAGAIFSAGHLSARVQVLEKSAAGVNDKLEKVSESIARLAGAVAASYGGSVSGRP